MARVNDRPPHPRADRVRRELADNISTWRRMLGLTQDQLAQRAGISRTAYIRVEAGEPGVTTDALLRVLAALRLGDAIVEATDPMSTDLGRARADQALPQRVRR
ncbi:helix-turn-helix domain-containing protein [Aeromicrobium phragmitis]|uniref:Helix-turn-helix domain-containing protein n=1 Tax=Aeromicrobium phragmitis TaxID=2478914 RepID=A0A3L8PMU5_9ACTN|nr:helix-turn-helix domain-containing protein [Aeromicrobium phragmitis]RLV56089.1 helix-turn-helix domain-containing protein [Aeromicrobium phragmitis]